MKFDHWSQWENPKMCNILKTAHRRANGRKFRTRGTMVQTCSVLLMPDSLSLVWGHSVHCVKFPMLRFSKGHYSPSFHSIWTKLYCKYVGHGGIQAVTVFGDLPKITNSVTLWIFSQHRTIWGWKFQNASSPTVFIWFQPSLKRTLATIGRIQAITFLGNQPSFKNFVAL